MCSKVLLALVAALAITSVASECVFAREIQGARVDGWHTRTHAGWALSPAPHPGGWHSPGPVAKPPAGLESAGHPPPAPVPALAAAPARAAAAAASLRLPTLYHRGILPPGCG